MNFSEKLNLILIAHYSLMKICASGLVAITIRSHYNKIGVNRIGQGFDMTIQMEGFENPLSRIYNLKKRKSYMMHLHF